MNATMRSIVWGTIPIGSIVGGLLGGAIGLHEMIWVGAIGSAFPLLFVLFPPVLGIGEMPAPIGDGGNDDGRPGSTGVIPG